MKKFGSKVASALSFAHLAGLGMRAKAEDEDDRKDDVEGDEPEKKDQDRENGDSKKGKKARRAEDDKDDKSAEGDDLDQDEDDEEDKPRGRKAEDEDPDAEDDDDEEEMRGTSAAAKARRRERARCAAIFASKAAGKNPALAANLAFNTSMTRKEAIVVLESSPATTAPTDSGRSARNPGLGAGGSVQGSSKQATASRWDAAFAKVAPRRR